VNPRFEAAWELHEYLTAHGVPYVIIGGTALSRWGEPRFTADVDLTVMNPLEGAEGFVRLILERFPSRVADPIAFARRNRMVLIRASNGCHVDISLALPGYEAQVMRRAADYELQPGRIVRVCSAEDLIIHKAVAGRGQDWADIEGVIARQGDALDVRYIRTWLREFANLLAKPDVLDGFEKLWRKKQTRATRKRGMKR